MVHLWRCQTVSAFIFYQFSIYENNLSYITYIINRDFPTGGQRVNFLGMSPIYSRKHKSEVQFSLIPFLHTVAQKGHSLSTFLLYILFYTLLLTLRFMSRLTLDLRFIYAALDLRFIYAVNIFYRIQLAENFISSYPILIFYVTVAFSFCLI
jgi:hypothetical protein